MKLKQKLMSLAMAAGLALSVNQASAEELSVATFIPPQHHINSFFFDWFGKEVAKRSNGSLTIKVYPAGQLGAGPVQQYKRVVEGVADITFGLQTYTPALFPKSILIVPPGKHTTSLQSTEAIWNVFDKYFADEYNDVKLLGMFTVAGDAWAATKDLSTLDGLSGSKVVPFATMTSPIFEAWGAVPVQMPVTEMYTGLSTGTIDGTSISASQMTPPWNFGEVSSHYIDNIPVSFAVFFVAMNKERYMELSDEHRAIIDGLAGKEVSMMGAQSFHNDSVRGMKAHESGAPQIKNVTFVSVSADERAKMDGLTAEALKKIFAEYAGNGIDNAEEIYNALNK
ncbi:MAG: TRAP transporter substrate-binding protein [Rhizobiaceae bacterium]|nr:TRAP transporter substrate-binding protein [Hyphomicrobiales bacterium]NRB32238.1 TRAP transporter substrate-binding protein [Rhizobiaceae bacterium]